MNKTVDIDLLRAFLAVYESSSFSGAAQELGRTQSSISQQVKKLEEILGRSVFLRSKRSVSLTTEGEVLLSYARKMLAMNDEIVGRISQADISGRVRLGVPEAFAANHLHGVLGQFVKSHPLVNLEVHCDLSSHLIAMLDNDELDLVLVKKPAQALRHGIKVWRESLVWAGCDKTVFHVDDVIPLVLSPEPCIYRSKIISALKEQGIQWRAAFTCATMTGRIAAAKAGYGVMALPQEMLGRTHGLMALRNDCGFPTLSAIEIDLIYDEHQASGAIKRLAEHIVFSLENDPSLNEAA